MPNIFDEIEEKENVFDKVSRQQPSKIRSVLGAFPKGALSETGEQVRKTLMIAPQLLGIDKKLEGTLKTEEEAASELEKLLPTQEGFAERALERGGRTLPYSLITRSPSLGSVLRPAAAGFLGQAIEEAGGGPLSQALAETLAFTAPGLGKKIIPTKAQKPLVEGARELGMAEKEIAPLIQERRKGEVLSKVAGKRFRTQKALKRSKSALDFVAEEMESHPSMQTVLAPPQAQSVMNEVDTILGDKFSAAEKKLVKEDLESLRSSPKSLKDFYKFFRDLNKVIAKNPDARKTLNLLKTPVTNAINEISPQFGKNFNLTNKLYSNYYNLSKKLTPSWKGIITSLGTKGVIHGVMGPLFGYVPSMIAVGGEIAAKNLAREMLINPRFQNLSKQMVSALNKNRIGVASQIWKKLSGLTREESPKIADEMEKIDWDSLREVKNQ